jgi:hypothetical protein
MALIYRLHCPKCSYAKEFADWALLLVNEDGSEYVCHHPGEVTQAEEFSKVPFAELKRTGRLFGAAPAWCGKCGSVEYYRSSGGFPRTSPDRDAWLQQMKCKACGQSGLLPATDSLAPWGGCSSVGLLFNIAVWPAIVFHPLWGLPGLAVLFGFVWWWWVIKSRERVRWSGLSCPACRAIGIDIARIAIS